MIPFTWFRGGLKMYPSCSEVPNILLHEKYQLKSWSFVIAFSFIYLDAFTHIMLQIFLFIQDTIKVFLYWTWNLIYHQFQLISSWYRWLLVHKLHKLSCLLHLQSIFFMLFLLLFLQILALLTDQACFIFRYS